jgi:hypothetical protein
MKVKAKENDEKEDEEEKDEALVSRPARKGYEWVAITSPPPPLPGYFRCRGCYKDEYSESALVRHLKTARSCPLSSNYRVPLKKSLRGKSPSAAAANSLLDLFQKNSSS